MPNVNPESQNSAPPAAAGATNQPVQTVIQGRDVVGRFTQAAPEEVAQQSGSQGQQPVSGKILVDDGGVQRHVDIGEVLKKAKTAEAALQEAESVKKAAQASMVRDAALRQLGERVDAMTPAQRQAFQRLLAGQEAAQSAPPSTDDDPFGVPQPPLPKAVQERMEALERLAMRSAEMLTSIGQERQQQTLAQRVEQAMTDLPVFGQIEQQLRDDTREAIMNDLAKAGSSADLEQIVLARAQKAQRTHQQYRGAMAGGVPVSGMSPGTPARRMTGKDLIAGNVLATAREAARQQGIIL